MPDIAATRPASGAPIETSWGDQVHDLVEGIQSGLASVTFSSTQGTVTVTFPKPYAVVPPILVVSMASNVSIATVSSATTTTTFVINARRWDGGGSTTQPVSWMAVGVLA